MAESDHGREHEHEHLAENYLVLLNQHERALAAYVHTLVHERADADDILQACKLTLWKKFDQFETGTNFLAWARKVALHQVLNHRRSEKRRPLYSTDPAFLESIAAEIDRQDDSLAVDRAEALEQCLKRLPETQRRTILLRYYEGCGIAEIAQQTDRTEAAVYRLLSRIREALNGCIRQKLEVATA